MRELRQPYSSAVALVLFTHGFQRNSIEQKAVCNYFCNFEPIIRTGQARKDLLFFVLTKTTSTMKL